MRAANWWSLFDWSTVPDVSGLVSCDFWRLELRPTLCNTGFFTAAGDEKTVSGETRTAWDEFVAGAQAAETWTP